jgi:hypothetical protein
MRPVLWYLAFVGVPFLALLGILRLGEGLVPPRAVHGQYSVTFDSSGSGRCVFDMLQDGERRLHVSQSGPRLELMWGSLLLEGSVSGDNVQAAAVLGDSGKPGSGSCLTADTMVLSGLLERTADADGLTGEFRMPGCATCAPVPFRAARLPDQRGASGVGH